MVCVELRDVVWAVCEVSTCLVSDLVVCVCESGTGVDWTTSLVKALGA